MLLILVALTAAAVFLATSSARGFAGSACTGEEATVTGMATARDATTTRLGVRMRGTVPPPARSAPTQAAGR